MTETAKRVLLTIYKCFLVFIFTLVDFDLRLELRKMVLKVLRNTKKVICFGWFIPTGMKGLPQNVLQFFPIKIFG